VPEGTTVLTFCQKTGIPVECFKEFTDFVWAHSDEMTRTLATPFCITNQNGT